MDRTTTLMGRLVRLGQWNPLVNGTLVYLWFRPVQRNFTQQCVMFAGLSSPLSS